MIRNDTRAESNRRDKVRLAFRAQGSPLTAREEGWQLVYIVQPGDTLGGIAAAFGTTVEAILDLNRELISDPDIIVPGWELELPRDPDPAEPLEMEYTVQPGDTLAALAVYWSTTVDAIARANGITDPNFIAVGQVLVRPASDLPAPPKPAPAGQLLFTVLPLVMPPSLVTGGYLEDYGGYLHRGIDIGGAPVGTPVIAPAPGIVAVHRPGDGTNFDSFGICVVIDHPGTPWWSIYAHMDDVGVAPGQPVSAGDVIGFVGYSGFVQPPGPGGAHLHWQLSNNRSFPRAIEATADPAAFLAPGLALRRWGRDLRGAASASRAGICSDTSAGDATARSRGRSREAAADRRR